MDEEAPVETTKTTRVVSRSRLAATLATVLAVEVVALCIYAYTRVQTALDPEILADRVETAIIENYPTVREEVVTYVQQESPQIAQTVSQTLVDAAPTARQELEQMTARQLEAGLDQATKLSAEQFRELLRNNREQIVKVFETIEAAPEEARELVLETEASIEQQLGVDMQRQAREALTIHRQLNQKLAKISSDQEDLSAKELLERRIVRVLRTMQERQRAEDRVANATAQR